MSNNTQVHSFTQEEAKKLINCAIIQHTGELPKGQIDGDMSGLSLMTTDYLGYDIRLYDTYKTFFKLLATAKIALFSVSNDKIESLKADLAKNGYDTPEKIAAFINYACYYHDRQVKFEHVFGPIKTDDTYKDWKPLKGYELSAVKAQVSEIKKTLGKSKAARQKLCNHVNNAIKAILENVQDPIANPLFTPLLVTIDDHYARSDVLRILGTNTEPLISADTKGKQSFTYKENTREVVLDFDKAMTFLVDKMVLDMATGWCNVWTSNTYLSLNYDDCPRTDIGSARINFLGNLIRHALYNCGFIKGIDTIIIKDISDYFRHMGTLQQYEGRRIENGPRFSRRCYCFPQLLTFDDRVNYIFTPYNTSDYVSWFEDWKRRKMNATSPLFPQSGLHDSSCRGISFDVDRKCLMFTSRYPIGSYHASKKRGNKWFWSEKSINVKERANVLYMGVELEMSVLNHMTDKYTKLINLLMVNNPYFDRVMSAETDSSINPIGLEFVFHPMTPKIASSVIPMFMNHPLIKEGFTADHESCGNHIHVNKKYFDRPMSFAKWFRFMGGDKNNRKLVEHIGERGAGHYNRSQYDKSLGNGLFFFTKNRDLEKHYDPNLEVRYAAINVNTEIPTYEVRIFKGPDSADTLRKNIEFVWASIRFATWINRSYLSGMDFMQWLERHPDDFPNLIKWLKDSVSTQNKPVKAWDTLYTSLQAKDILSFKSSKKPIKEADIKEEEGYVQSLLPKPVPPPSDADIPFKR